MCHLAKSVGLSVPPVMCRAVSDTLCTNFLLSEFKAARQPGVTHISRLAVVAGGTSTWLQETLCSGTSTLGQPVDRGRGVGAADKDAHSCHSTIKMLRGFMDTL